MTRNRRWRRHRRRHNDPSGAPESGGDNGAHGAPDGSPDVVGDRPASDRREGAPPSGSPPPEAPQRAFDDGGPGDSARPPVQADHAQPGSGAGRRPPAGPGGGRPEHPDSEMQRRRRRRHRRHKREPGFTPAPGAPRSQHLEGERGAETGASPGSPVVAPGNGGPSLANLSPEERKKAHRRRRHRQRRHRKRLNQPGRDGQGFTPGPGSEGVGDAAPGGDKQKFGSSWWADRWIKMLESFGHSNRLPRGRYYARSRRVFDFQVGPAEVTARVQGSRPQPYSVRIEVTPLDDRAWERVIEAMASQAVFAAKLLSGEMPQNIGEVFAQASVSLFPKLARDLRVNCSCPDSASLCKHSVAVNYILAEAFDRDPFILLHLRGRSRDEVIDALTARRARLVAGDDLADGTGLQPSAAGSSAEEAASGEERAASTDPAKFYDLAVTLDDVTFHMDPPSVPHAVLSSLGPPPTHNPGQAEAVLSTCYALISQQALEAAYGREQEAKPEAPLVQPAPPAVPIGPSITSTQISLKSTRE